MKDDKIAKHVDNANEVLCCHIANENKLAAIKENNILYLFANQIINGMGGLRDYERYEGTVENCEHDICVAIWTLRCLSNPSGKFSKDVLDAVLERFEELKGQ